VAWDRRDADDCTRILRERNKQKKNTTPMTHFINGTSFSGPRRPKSHISQGDKRHKKRTEQPDPPPILDKSPIQFTNLDRN